MSTHDDREGRGPDQARLAVASTPNTASTAMAPSASRSARSMPLFAGEIALFGALLGWLGIAALLVQVDYYDGWDTISNTRLFAGTLVDGAYIPNRAPLMSWLLLPGEALRWVGGADALDLRPYHLISAGIHAIYLLGVYLLLCRIFERSWAVWLAFVAALPTFLFFAYARYLSHDLAPGFLLLAMVVVVARFLERPTAGSWLLLVVLGAGASLIKQIYGAFWIALLVAILALRLVPAWRHTRGEPSWRGIAALVAAAATSGVATWLILAAVLGQSIVGESLPFLERPLVQLQGLGGQPGEFPLWVYLRNAPAFGLLTVLAVLPGWWLSRRSSDPVVRLTVVVWPVLVLVFHVLSFREVRYLAFLAPLSAVLLVPAISWALQRRWAAIGVVALLAIECIPPFHWARIPEALTVFEPFYRIGEARVFLSEVRARRAGMVYYQGEPLGFRPPEPSRLVGDRYSELYHIGPHHVRNLLELSYEEFSRVPKGLEMAALPPEAILVASTGAVINGNSWSQSTRIEEPWRSHYIAESRTWTLRPGDDGWDFDGRGPIGVEWRGEQLVLHGRLLAEALGGSLSAAVVVDDTVARLWPVMADRFTVRPQEARGLKGARELQIVATVVVRRHAYQTR